MPSAMQRAQRSVLVIVDLAFRNIPSTETGSIRRNHILLERHFTTELRAQLWGKVSSQEQFGMFVAKDSRMRRSYGAADIKIT